MVRSSFFRCRNAAGLYSTLQPKFLAHLFAGETRTAFGYGLFGRIAVFHVVDIGLDELAGKLALGPSGALGKCGQPFLDIRIEQQVSIV